MAYQLRVLREHFDEQTQTHHLHVRLAELDEAGQETGQGEEFQRAFCLPGHEDDFDFERELDELKARLVKRYERTKAHRARLGAALAKLKS